LEEIIPGALYIISTPIGNLGDISHRALHILAHVDLVAAEDTRKSALLFRKYGISTKMVPFHSYNQKNQVPRLVQRLQSGESIALISDAGTPGISDPAYALVTACCGVNCTIVPVPGASALLAALVVSGLPTNRFVFEGFLPSKKGRQKRIRELQTEARTLVLYESPHRIKKTVASLLENWGDRRCTLGREITKKFEEFYRGTLGGLLTHLDEGKPRGEMVLVIAGARETSGRSTPAESEPRV
jgi:16S rRNA (cytidine1402-2'-O)-methyltransferase